MIDNDALHESKPVVRVELKRLNLDERVLGDADLRHAPCARLLGEAALRDLLAAGTGRRFSDGARIFHEGDTGDSLFLLLKGEARLTARSLGAAVDVADVRKGDVMGEREALGESTIRSCSAIAVGEVELVEFPRAIVGTFARLRPEFGLHLRGVAQDRRAAGEEMADFLARW